MCRLIPAVTAATLCGALIGFAFFNKPVAKLFLGDVGSLPIGLLVGWLLLQLAGTGALAAAILLPLYYLMDATITLLRRLARREKVWEAHRSHFYQQATANGFSVMAVSGACVRAQHRAGGACRIDDPAADTHRADRRPGGGFRAGRAVAASFLATSRGGRSMSAPLIALTGATGFIGRHLVAELPKRGYRVRVLLRRPTEVPLGATGAVIGDIASPHNMAAALRDVDAVVHSAGLAHAMSGMPADDYRAINTQGTINLARAAERAHVKRFVFLSSIRAQSGPVSAAALTEADAPHPTDDYGRSKLEAEEGLNTLGIDWVALRPVLVYGTGREGQHGGLAGARADRLAAAARRAEGQTLAAVARQSHGGARCGAEGARPAAASVRRGRSGAAECRRDRRRDALRSRAQAGTCSGAVISAARGSDARRQVGGL